MELGYGYKKSIDIKSLSTEKEKTGKMEWKQPPSIFL